MECQNEKTPSQATPQVIYQPIVDPRGLPKLMLTEFSGDPLKWLEWAELFDVIVHQKRPSNAEKMQYLKISLTGQAKAAISFHRHTIRPGTFSAKTLADRNSLLNLNSRRYTHILQLDMMIPSSSIVRFSKVVTNTVKVLTRLGFQHDLESEGVLSSSTRKFPPQFKEQWLRHLQDHRLLVANLIVFKNWLELTAFMHEDLLAQTNPKFQNRKKPKTGTVASNTDDSTKPKNSKCPFKDGQHAIWSYEKFKSMKPKK